MVVHRVIEIEQVKDEYIFYTKGDNNNGPDGYPILSEDCIGLYKRRIRYIGLPSVMLTDLLT